MKKRNEIELNGIVNALALIEMGASTDQVVEMLLDFCRYVRSDYTYWHDYRIAKQIKEDNLNRKESQCN